MTSASEARSPETPILRQGPFNLFTAKELQQLPPGQVVVLTGPGLDPVSRKGVGWGAVLASVMPVGYSVYTVVDQTLRKGTRTETVSVTKDPLRTIKLTVNLQARVIDPIAYVSDHSMAPSIFDEPYSSEMPRIRSKVANWSLSELEQLSIKLNEFCDGIEKERPQYGSVQLVGFRVTVSHGPEKISDLRKNEIANRYYNEGEDSFIFENAVDPSVAERNSKMIEQLRQSRDRRREQDDLDREAEFKNYLRTLEALKSTTQVTGEEAYKLAKWFGLENLARGLNSPLFGNNNTMEILGPTSGQVQIEPRRAIAALPSPTLKNEEERVAAASPDD